MSRLRRPSRISTWSARSKKFGIIQISAAERIDIGIKRKGIAPAPNALRQTGSWNAMVTHRVRISEPQQIDGEVVEWLKAAYAAA